MRSTRTRKMSKLVSALLISGAACAPVAAHAGVTVGCPAAGSATGCNEVIDIGAGNVLTFTTGPSLTPYDGSDDNLIGVQNNSGHSISGLTLSGYTFAGGIFEFDGDGISTYLNGGVPYGSDTTGYAGPGTSFSNISSVNYTDDTGTVNFIGGLADGQVAWFSLEGPASCATGVSCTIGGTVSSVPEPSTYAMLLAGLGLIGFAAYRRKSDSSDNMLMTV
jgi:PEP-CTERM motif